MPEHRTRPPRHEDVAPVELEPGGGDVLLPGDLLEGRDIRDLDVVDRALTGLVVEECRIGTLRAGDADLGMLRVRDTVVDVLDAPVFRTPRSTWRSVVIRSGRIGSAEWYDSTFDDVRVIGAKLGFVNLRAATLRDVTFEDCTIEELDLGGVVADRVAFPGCRIHELSAAGSRLRDVDLRGADVAVVADAAALRGATVSEVQSALLATSFARALGVVVD
ncbi:MULTISPECIES: pentapeptide repeat-containing protein [unclassified Curtobacterium]|uniref:pentapeptide repeat-containing protein n=1 Tax=unclassified Curtobacterium TaxID=257496 RepID=UPI000DA806F4|nr:MULTISPECIES: pentapeptide repeat-containing protein [unclassified Curtobacterium]PZE27305.1 pentapeptide repeat-containing protein [Curtobacterium sp. MCBD17_028]PZE76187.1 pentapeptide repeat-containing protein [Curtobacterium sp. MCBD17_019]WIB63401.1 pentapeptide repeat-containing protein [Curtobacterium sp. MCBD17_040]WIE54417.1 pentapeptide repeat-containing protein [Curtobacterium sp. MCBD17_003]